MGAVLCTVRCVASSRLYPSCQQHSPSSVFSYRHCQILWETELLPTERDFWATYILLNALAWAYVGELSVKTGKKYRKVFLWLRKRGKLLSELKLVLSLDKPKGTSGNIPVVLEKMSVSSLWNLWNVSLKGVPSAVHIAKPTCKWYLGILLDGLPWWLSGRESACQCRRHKFDPWVGKIPAEGNGYLLHILAWDIPWTEEAGGLQSMGLQKSLTWLNT